MNKAFKSRKQGLIEAIEHSKQEKVLPLIDTNPFLKGPKQRKKLIRRSVETSSAVEGIKVKLGGERNE